MADLRSIPGPDQADRSGQGGGRGREKALPADRATLTLAQCSMIARRPEAGRSVDSEGVTDEGKPDDPAALRLAAGLYLGQNRVDKADEYLDKLDRAASLSPGDKAWANRTRTALLLKQGPACRPGSGTGAGRAEPEEPIPTASRTRCSRPRSSPCGPAVAVRPITILEQLAGANRLDANERFLLAQLYLGERNEEKYQGEMLKLLNLKRQEPAASGPLRQLLDRPQPARPGRSLARRAEEGRAPGPRGPGAGGQAARPAEAQARAAGASGGPGRAVPDQIGPVADLLNRYGFAKEAEEAYKAFVAREPKQPERVLALAQFLARQDRVAEAMAILKKAWSTCRPEQVAAAALPVYDAPSADEAAEAAGGSLGGRGRPEAARCRPCSRPNWGLSGFARAGSTRRRRCFAGSWPAIPITRMR